MGEAVLLLADGEVERFRELPADPEFGEAIVGRFEIAAADRLRVHGQSVEHRGLETEADAAALETGILTVAAVVIVVMSVIAAEHPQLLQAGVLLVLVDQAQVLEALLQRLFGDRLGGGRRLLLGGDLRDGQSGREREKFACL